MEQHETTINVEGKAEKTAVLPLDEMVVEDGAPRAAAAPASAPAPAPVFALPVQSSALESKAKGKSEIKVAGPPEGKEGKEEKKEKKKDKKDNDTESKHAQLPLTLISNDNHRFLLQHRFWATKLSQTINAALEEDHEATKFRCRIRSQFLGPIVTYMQHHKGVIPPFIPKPATSKNMSENIPGEDKWEATFIDEFVKSTGKTTEADVTDILFEFGTAVVNYLGMKGLDQLICCKLSTFWFGKPKEVIKATFLPDSKDNKSDSKDGKSADKKKNESKEGKSEKDAQVKQERKAGSSSQVVSEQKNGKMEARAGGGAGRGRGGGGGGVGGGGGGGGAAMKMEKEINNNDEDDMEGSAGESGEAVISNRNHGKRENCDENGDAEKTREEKSDRSVKKEQKTRKKVKAKRRVRK